MRFCSQRCRSERGTARLDRELEAAIERLLGARTHGATICPSEAARAVRPQAWPQIMERTRSAARRMCARGDLEILKAGRPVDPSTARGPIRLRRARR
jgi:hypothetical protein